MTKANGGQTSGSHHKEEENKQKGREQSNSSFWNLGKNETLRKAAKSVNILGKNEKKEEKNKVVRDQDEKDNKGWENVKNGPSGEVIIEEETVEYSNSFEILNEQENEKLDKERENWIEEEQENESFNGKKWDVQKIELNQIQAMSIEDVSETVFQQKRNSNSNLEKRDIYRKEEKELRVMLIRMVNERIRKDFLYGIDAIAQTIKEFDIEQMNTKMEEVVNIVQEVEKLSEVGTKRNMYNMKEKFLHMKEMIVLIEEFAKEPTTMIPKNMIQIKTCTRAMIDEMDYFQLAMAIVYDNGEIGDTMQKHIKQLRTQAAKQWRMHLKDKENREDKTPKKRSKMDTLGKEESDEVTPMDTSDMNPTDNTNEVTIVTPEKPKDNQNKERGKTMITSKNDSRKADLRAQAQNLNGINISNMTPKEDKANFNFCLPTMKEQEKDLVRKKTSYIIHNKIHVEKMINAQKVVQMLFRVLRKADPTVLLLPYDGTTSQNQYIDVEDNIPEEENELKKYISVAKRQYAKKFVFSMRISITETPVLVKNRIFDWCRGQHHYVDFKQIQSANVFAAGWLYRLHQNYYNRDHVREWMTRNNESLKHHIHLAPAKLFKETTEGGQLKRILTRGIRVEVTFEKKEEIMQQLYKLKWQQGPYKDSLFIPFRSNEEYTEEMQVQFMKNQKNYIEQEVQQKVFRMKGADWEIRNLQNEQITTFRKWLRELTVNGIKVLSSVEIGDDHYVRMIYHPKYHRQIQHVYRHLYDTTKITFGEENTEKMFCLTQSPVKGEVYVLEEEYAKTLQDALQSNPQQDETDYVPTKVPERKKNAPTVYFGTSTVDRTYASITNQKQKSNNNGSKQMEDNNNGSTKTMKEIILKEVTEEVDVRLNAMETKLQTQIQQVKKDNDAKIDSLAELMKENQVNSKKDLQNQLQSNNEVLLKQFSLMVNPPGTSVENNSRDGGGQN